MSKGSDFQQSVRSVALANATAFGYSILITATFGLLAELSQSVNYLDVLGATLATLAVFTLVEIWTTGQLRRKQADDSQEDVLFGTSLNILAVGVSITAAYGVAVLLRGAWEWTLASGIATAAYILILSLEQWAFKRYRKRHHRHR